MSTETDALESAVKAMVSKFQEQNLVAGIQVFVTLKSGDKCYAYCHGGGDWYSRYGYITEWVETQKARAWEQVRNEKKEE